MVFPIFLWIFFLSSPFYSQLFACALFLLPGIFIFYFLSKIRMKNDDQENYRNIKVDFMGLFFPRVIFPHFIAFFFPGSYTILFFILSRKNYSSFIIVFIHKDLWCDNSYFSIPEVFFFFFFYFC